MQLFWFLFILVVSHDLSYSEHIYYHYYHYLIYLLTNTYFLTYLLLYSHLEKV